MKIAHICAFYPPHLGGLEYCAKYVSQHLSANGHDVQVLTSNVGAGKARTEQPYPNMRVHYLPGFEFAHTPVIPVLPFKLWKLEKDTMLHIHLSHIYTEVMVWAVARLRRMPYVAHFHMDVDVSGRLGFLFKLYKKTLLPFIIRGAARVITLSDEQRQLVIDRYHATPEHVRVVPNGVSEEFFSDAPRTFSHTPLKLLFVGRFGVQKNLPRLLHALPLLEHPVELHLVGDGERREEVEQVIRDLGLTNVTLHGPRTPSEVAALCRQADIFVLPSNREGMPLVLLEAAASGLPIVASDVQGLREFVGSNGVLVRDPSPETFAAELNKLLADPTNLQQLSTDSRAWANSYAWVKLVKHIESLYEEVEAHLVHA